MADNRDAKEQLGGAPFPVVIIGGGLAGLAAAARLAQQAAQSAKHESNKPKVPITLIEARSSLGGRAGAFIDAETGEWLDLCQHVSLGCCDEFWRLMQRLGCENEFIRERTLHFIGPDGRVCRFTANPYLPAPLHLAGGMRNLSFLTWAEKCRIGWTFWRLWRSPPGKMPPQLTFGRFLRDCGNSPRLCELFWTPVVESALSDTLEQVGYAAAHKVFYDAFLSRRDGYEMLIPRRPLAEILHERALPWLREQGVEVKLGTTVKLITGERGSNTDETNTTAAPGGFRVQLADGGSLISRRVILAVPWHKVAGVLEPAWHAQLPWLAGLATLPATAIISVHLGYDQPLTELPHAVLPGRVSQWVFARGGVSLMGASPDRFDSNPLGYPHVNETSLAESANPPAPSLAYLYQVVISAADELLSWSNERLGATVDGELRGAFAVPPTTRLLQARVIRQPRAVFAPRPGCDALRPPARTEIPGLNLAGDWIATGWPATMESAVRSGSEAIKNYELRIELSTNHHPLTLLH
ncbi:MAG: hydroxysqualene dehydroxylase HpnE [Pirellulales bacterium]|nr:hydroxysqualene dehydroxylase HpnE [Pirellulales bacterium]